MIRVFKNFRSSSLKNNNWLLYRNGDNLLLKATSIRNFEFRSKKDDTNFSALFKPVPIKTSSDDINIGAELTGVLDKAEVLKILNKFSQKKEVKLMCSEHGLDSM